AEDSSDAKDLDQSQNSTGTHVPKRNKIANNEEAILSHAKDNEIQEKSGESNETLYKMQMTIDVLMGENHEDLLTDSTHKNTRALLSEDCFIEVEYTYETDESQRGKIQQQQGDMMEITTHTDIQKEWKSHTLSYRDAALNMLKQDRETEDNTDKNWQEIVEKGYKEFLLSSRNEEFDEKKIDKHPEQDSKGEYELKPQLPDNIEELKRQIKESYPEETIIILIVRYENITNTIDVLRQKFDIKQIPNYILDLPDHDQLQWDVYDYDNAQQ
ncbi:26367_t:CDS:2, partial [Gigaspora margarita]